MTNSKDKVGMKRQFYFLVLISLRENKFLCQGLNRIVFVSSLFLTVLLNGFISFFSTRKENRFTFLNQKLNVKNKKLC